MCNSWDKHSNIKIIIPGHNGHTKIAKSEKQNTLQGSL